MKPQSPIRVALVHDWLTGMRGGEYVLEAIADIFPRTDLFTLLYVPGKIAPSITALKRHTSFLQKIPYAEKRYRSFLPWMPKFIEAFDLSEFDLIISSSHCVAKGVKKREDAVHVSYVHAPMRYMWDRYEDYFGKEKASFPVRLAAKHFRSGLQEWDFRVSQADRVDTLIANSCFISEQIKRAYHRDSKVIYPFADLSRFNIPRKRGSSYLMVGAFAPYKRVDLAIQAFNELKLPLFIVGAGQENEKLKKMAGPTIDFLGSISNAAITDLYAKCRAFVFPGKEDFGITPLEALASGTPVIAFGEGGASETVTEKTGVFFREQTVASLKEAVMKIESGTVAFSESDCRARAAEFSRDRFQRELIQAIQETWVARGKDLEQLNDKIRMGWSVVAQSV